VVSDHKKMKLTTSVWSERKNGYKRWRKPKKMQICPILIWIMTQLIE